MQPLCRHRAAIALLIGSLFLATSCSRFRSSRTSEQQARLAAAVQEAVQGKTRPDYVTRDRDGARLWKVTGPSINVAISRRPG